MRENLPVQRAQTSPNQKKIILTPNNINPFKLYIMKNLIENYQDAAVYCGTYAKYNDGSIAGEWMKFSDYSNSEEFFTACAELHKDEEDPEYMFQDSEYLPDFLYSESLSETDVDKIYEYLEVAEKLEDADWLGLWNQYCDEMNNGDQVYAFDEEFFEIFFNGTKNAMDAVQKTVFGDVVWSHEYITFDGYANFKTYADADDAIEYSELIPHILENSHAYSL